MSLQIALLVGGTDTLFAKFKDGTQHDTVKHGEIKFQVSDESVISFAVADDGVSGLITALAPGVADINVVDADDNLTKHATVTVQAGTATQIVLTDSNNSPGDEGDGSATLATGSTDTGSTATQG